MATFWRFLVLLLCVTGNKAASLSGLLSANKPIDVDVEVANEEKDLSRLPRDSNMYLLSRYANPDSAQTASGLHNHAVKPEDTSEGRQSEHADGGLAKRCSRCNYDDDRGGYDSRSRYYDDRTYRSRYPDYDYDRYDRYFDRYDRDRSGYDRDRYDRHDRYDNRDRYDSRDRYDRYVDRGTGYDNRGYDYRGGSGGRPYDDFSSRGYDRGYGGGYASNYYYGRGGGGGGGAGGGDDYHYRDRGWNDRGYYGGGGGGGGGSGGGGYYNTGGHSTGGYGGSGYRGHDPYYPYYDNGYRGTSYLYGRPSSTTTPPSLSSTTSSAP